MAQKIKKVSILSSLFNGRSKRSSWSGLARPLFCRTNLHSGLWMHVKPYIHIRTSKLSHLGKRLPIIVKIWWEKGIIELGFSVLNGRYFTGTNSVLPQAGQHIFSWLLHVCAAKSICAKSEDNYLSTFPLFAVCTTSDGKLGGGLGPRLLIQYSIWILLAKNYS